MSYLQENSLNIDNILSNNTKMGHIWFQNVVQIKSFYLGQALYLPIIEDKRIVFHKNCIKKKQLLK